MRYSKVVSFSLMFLMLIGCSSDDDAREVRVDKSGNLKVLGTSANELLSDARFTSMRVEIVSVTGFEPTKATLDNLQEFLTERAFKPDGIEITTRSVASSGKAPFSIEEIREIEKNQRTAFNTGDEITVFIYFADGSKEDDTSTIRALGSAYMNTSMVIFGKTVKDMTGRFGAPSKALIESTVLNHEFGHLFGLVNIGSPMQNPHEDSESKAHCNVAGCLMQANIQFSKGLAKILRNKNQIPQLDPLCIQDLQANGGR